MKRSYDLERRCMTNCILCNSSAFDVLWKNKGYKLKRCERCSLIYTDPQVSVSDHQLFYDRAYYRNNYLKYESYYRDFFAERLRQIEVYKKGGNLLDVGCGIGTFLDIARQKGWMVYGVDFSSSAVSFAKAHYKLSNIFNEQLQEMNCKAEHFDVITMFDVLMHLHRPIELLMEVNRILKRDGILVIKVANRPTFFIRLIYFLFLAIRSKGSGLLNLPHAFYHFTPKTLSNLIDIAGFRVIRVEGLSAQRSLKQTTPLKHLKMLMYCTIRSILVKISIPKSHFVVYARKKRGMEGRYDKQDSF